MTLYAIGIEAQRLPDLISLFNQQSDFNVYPEKPVYDNQIDSSGNKRTVNAKKTQEFTLVPKRAGVLTLPAIKLYWWDIWKNQLSSTALAAKQLSVLNSQGQMPLPHQRRPVVEKNMIASWSNHAVLLAAIACVLLGWGLAQIKIPLYARKCYQRSLVLWQTLYFGLTQVKSQLHHGLMRFSLYQRCRQHWVFKFKPKVQYYSNILYWQRFIPLSVHSFHLLQQIERSTQAQSALSILQQFAHRHLHARVVASPTQIGSCFLQHYTQLEGQAVTGLFIQLNRLLYAPNGRTTWPAWQQQFKQQFQYLPFYARHTSSTCLIVGLLPLNPRF